MWSFNLFLHPAVSHVFHGPGFSESRLFMVQVFLGPGFTSSQFHEQIFRSNRSPMFLKIGAPKNSAIFWIKKRLQDMYFSINIAKFLKQLFYRTPPVAAVAFFKKVIKQPFVNLNRFLKERSCYDVLIILLLNAF